MNFNVINILFKNNRWDDWDKILEWIFILVMWIWETDNAGCCNVMSWWMVIMIIMTIIITIWWDDLVNKYIIGIHVIHSEFTEQYSTSTIKIKDSNWAKTQHHNTIITITITALQHSSSYNFHHCELDLFLDCFGLIFPLLLMPFLTVL